MGFSSFVVFLCIIISSSVFITSFVVFPQFFSAFVGFFFIFVFFFICGVFFRTIFFFIFFSSFVVFPHNSFFICGFSFICSRNNVFEYRFYTKNICLWRNRYKKTFKISRFPTVDADRINELAQENTSFNTINFGQ